MRQLLEQGRARSGTFRGLLHEIQHSDLIVHIVIEPLQAGVDGQMRFVTAAGGTRFVRISVRPGIRTQPSRQTTQSFGVQLFAPKPKAYSLDSASTGSILVTRRAGRKLAIRLANARVAATATNTAESRGFT